MIYQIKLRLLTSKNERIKYLILWKFGKMVKTRVKKGVSVFESKSEFILECLITQKNINLIIRITYIKAYDKLLMDVNL